MLSYKQHIPTGHNNIPIPRSQLPYCKWQ